MRTNRTILTLALLTLATTLAVGEVQALEGPLAAGSPAQGSWVGNAENRATSNTDQLAHESAQVRLTIAKDGALDGYAPSSGCRLRGQVRPGSHASRLRLDLSISDCHKAALNGQLKDGEIGLPTPATAVIKINGRDESNGARRYLTFGAKLARLQPEGRGKVPPVLPIAPAPAARSLIDLTTPAAAPLAPATPEILVTTRHPATPDTHAKAKTSAKSGAKTKGQAAAKSNTKAKGKHSAKPDAKTKGKAASKSSAKAKGKAAAKPDAKAKTKAAAKPSAKAKTASKADAKAKPTAKSAARPKAHAGA
ncbi:MAG TPA: hypothetical protein VER09_03850 [Pseudomonas sp.]|nr:hypothetical protein [Pseudomonas sp.]